MSEPDEEQLKRSLQGRELSPELATFLKNLIRTKKWTRKITLPSSHDDLAVALVSTSTLKEGGLEIVSELHVFFDGDIIVEEWQMVGEREKTSALPKEMFGSISIHKVVLEGNKVNRGTQSAHGGWDGENDRKDIRFCDGWSQIALRASSSF